MKKILVVLGHPSQESFCGALSKQYVEAARTAGHEVRLLALGDLRFDPLVRVAAPSGSKEEQPLEEDLRRAQSAISWAEHLVFVYPIWWGGLPALLKGFIDRAFTPGFAFKYHENNPWWDRLLQGRSARLLATMDAPPWYYQWFSKMPAHHQMKKTILQFCGIKPVRISSFGPMRGSSVARRAKWLRQVSRLAAQGK